MLKYYVYSVAAVKKRGREAVTIPLPISRKKCRVPDAVEKLSKYGARKSKLKTVRYCSLRNCISFTIWHVHEKLTKNSSHDKWNYFCRSRDTSPRMKRKWLKPCMLWPVCSLIQTSLVLSWMMISRKQNLQLYLKQGARWIQFKVCFIISFSCFS